MKVIPETRCAH